MKVLRACALSLVVMIALLASWRHSPAVTVPVSLSGACGVVPNRLAIPLIAAGNHDRVPVVSVCIDGHGPYHFVVSSGEGVSIVTPRVARTLHLRSIVPLVPVLGVTCAVSTREVVVQKWSIGGLPLASQGLLVAPVPSESLHPQPVGVIGSDVLSRFQAVQVDLHSRRLRMEYPESPPPTSTAFVIGKANAKPPSTLVKGRPKLSVPLTVLIGRAGTTISAAVTFGSTTAGASSMSFLVDSGSARSSVVQSAATQSSLRPATGRSAAWGAGCRGTEPQVKSDSWSVDNRTLPSQRLSVATIAGGVNQALDGVLGADVLGSFESYVIDYQYAYLWVGGKP